VLLLVCVPAIASADAWNELGLVRSQLDMGGGHVVDGYAVRFAPRVNVHDHIYLGAEMDGGRIDGSIATPTAFRSSGGETGPTTTVTGEAYAVRAVVGLRMRAGSISAGAELAGGFHRAELRDAKGLELATIESDTTLIEGRARIDLWITPRVTIGGVAGVELDQPSSMTAGLMLGLHFADFDAMP
jgi:hypothetical protein